MSNFSESHHLSTAQRDELHRTIWRIADDLRGSVDGWEFKNYVLGMLFYRYISENLTAYVNKEEHEAGKTDFSYADLDGDIGADIKESLVEEKGFFIPPSHLFQNLCKAAQSYEAGTDSEEKFLFGLNYQLQEAFDAIEQSALGTSSEEDIQGLFDDFDVESNRLGSSQLKRNKRLRDLMVAIGKIDLGRFEDNTIDLFGDAYEFLMGMYASQAGKSGGEYFTPQEVSELLARITVVGKKRVNKVYDPACGSGSLLLKFRKVLGEDGVEQGYFGQEINVTTYNLARINMFLHNMNFEEFNIAVGDTLLEPRHDEEEPFEAIVSNPPYSIKWEGNDNKTLINDPRYAPAGVLAPKSKADLAFVMHMLSYLATNGTAAVVSFPGVLYRGGAEQKIRKYLIDNNFVDAVIQLPSDLFFGTTIATCILVLKKSKLDNKVLFIDASSEFVRSGNRNRLTEENQKKILDAYVNREDIPFVAQLISNNQIGENEYNLAVSSYVQPEDVTEKVDIVKLNQELVGIVERQSALRLSIDKLIAEMGDLS